MKKVIIVMSVTCILISCGQNPENGGEEIRSNEQRSDTPVSISNYSNEGDSGNNSRYDDGNISSSNSSGMHGERTTEGTRQDSQKTKANALYKGDNSDTNKKPK
jgi:hypothetical protein